MNRRCSFKIMEMRAIEDLSLGQDLTPPIHPLAFALYDSALNSHCSACFSPLPTQPFPPFSPSFHRSICTCQVPNDKLSIFYCSSRCSSLDSALHFCSAEPHLLSLFLRSPLSTWSDSSDLRLSLRLFYTFQKLNLVPQNGGGSLGDERLKLGVSKEDPLQENKNIKGPDKNLENEDEPLKNTETCNQNDDVSERIAGLMTNRERLMLWKLKNDSFQESEDATSSSEDETILERIREGTKTIALARRMCAGEKINLLTQHEYVVEEMVLCLVLTNAVEVQDKSGRSIGIAVYGTRFSWINHSCSPNACYRFPMGSDANEQPFLRIFPAATNNRGGIGCGVGVAREGTEGYGPRVIVRSIKAINKGEEVTIAYTDLLQPKEIRQNELFLKYQFSCSCKRCCEVPTSYVDSALQMVSMANSHCPDIIFYHNLYREEEIKNLREGFENAMSDYLSFDNPQLCCEKLENLLMHGNIDVHLEPEDAQLHKKLKLQPFHHLSLNAYTTLASAYKVHASDLLAIDSDRHKRQALIMYRTSAAYSLMLAGVAHHLFTFEPSLVASVSNFWMSAGESLLNLTKNSLWVSSLKTGPVKLDIPSMLSIKCHECSCANILEPNDQYRDVRFQEIKMQLLNHIANLISKVWSTLTSESSFLKLIPNPVDFRWLESSESLSISGYESDLGKFVETKGCSQFEVEEWDDQLRIDLIHLSTHCLWYGALLSSICHDSAPSIDMYRDRILAFIK